MNTILIFGSALVTGVLLGILGGGGSILTVPVLVYLVGLDEKTAIAATFPVVAATALVGMSSHWRAGRVRVRTALTFGAATMLGALGGSRLSHFLSGKTQLLILGILMISAAVAMWRTNRGTAEVPPAPREHPLLLGLTGIAVGTLTGLVGIGGGFIIVPALVVLAAIPMRDAVGTSLLIIAMSSTAGWLGHLDRALPMIPLILPFTSFAIAGSLLGAALVPHVPQATLKRGFAIFLLGLGVLVAAKNLMH